jgi:hypothetical protein
MHLQAEEYPSNPTQFEAVCAVHRPLPVKGVSGSNWRHEHHLTLNVLIDDGTEFTDTGYDKWMKKLDTERPLISSLSLSRSTIEGADDGKLQEALNKKNAAYALLFYMALRNSTQTPEVPNTRVIRSLKDGKMPPPLPDEPEDAEDNGDPSGNWSGSSHDDDSDAEKDHLKDEYVTTEVGDLLGSTAAKQMVLFMKLSVRQAALILWVTAGKWWT